MPGLGSSSIPSRDALGNYSGPAYISLGSSIGAGSIPPGIGSAPTPSTDALGNYSGPLYAVLTNQTFYNVKQYGALVDGVTSDSAIIAALAATLTAANGGLIYIPEGTCRAHLPIYSNVHYLGAGPGATIVKLEDGANTDVFYGTVNGYGGGVMCNPAAANATGAAGGCDNWSISNMSIDGNKANQSGTSYCIHQYGLNFNLLNLKIRNGLSGGILSDWNGGSSATELDNLESFVTNVKVHDCGGIGIDWGGPHDASWSGVYSHTHTSHGVHIGPNATGMLCASCHSYQPPLGNSSVSWLIEGNSGQYSNFVAEGSDTCNCVLLALDCTFAGARVYGITGSTQRVLQTGMQLGQAAGGTPYNGSALQAAGLTTAFQTAGLHLTGEFTLNNGGSINFVNEASNIIDIIAYQTAGNHYIGSPSKSTSRRIMSTDTNVNDASFTLPYKGSNAFNVNDKSVDIFNISTSGKQAQLSNSTILRFFSDSGTTRTMDLGTNGTLSTQQSATAVAVATSGQITTTIGVSRVAPTGNVTAVTLQAGSLSGQYLTIINESAFTITFDVQATSKISNGASNVIAAGGKLILVWDSVTALWY